MPAFKNIAGQRFGRLVALECQGFDRRGNALWLCRCDCDTETVIRGYALKSGNTKACGCLNREVSSAMIVAFTKHRQCETPTYSAWMALRARCNNPKHHNYPRYGGRGIKARYPGFEAFLSNMGEKPLGHDIHRLDNDGDYAPGNCVWLPHDEHMRLHNRKKK